MFHLMERERSSLLKRIIRLVYFMRGGLQYDVALTRTHVERELMESLIEERLKNESEKMYPNY